MPGPINEPTKNPEKAAPVAAYLYLKMATTINGGTGSSDLVSYTSSALSVSGLSGLAVINYYRQIMPQFS